MGAGRQLLASDMPRVVRPGVLPSMRWLASSSVVILLSLVPWAHGLLASIAGGSGAYALGTALMLVLAAVLPALWPPTADLPGNPKHFWFACPVMIAGLAILGWVSVGLLPPIFAGPLDPNRGDMLVIIEHAIAQFLAGGNPYAIHHVPWDAPLSYGPVLWMPFILPHLLQADLRILTLAAQLVIPASLLVAAAYRAASGERRRSAALVSLAAALALNPSMLRFHEIGHTQIYWPLLLIFAIALAGRHWTWAAICLGLLVAARTTMVALVPVFFLQLFVTGVLTGRIALAFVLAAALPVVPFAIADPGSVYYAMFGVYLKVMKGFVWHQTTWAQNTYGVTGRLLEHGLERYVEVAQVAALTIVYAVGWRSLRRGGPAEPWMVLALLVFSMTTLWPVEYLYYDVCVLAACCLLASDCLGALRSARPTRRFAAVAAVATICAAMVLGAAAVRPGARYTIDIGDPLLAGYTGGGFGKDVVVEDAGRRVVWIEGESARIRVPRAGWRGATIRVAIRPHIVAAGAGAGPTGLVQRVSASINGHALGAVTLAEGWQEITFQSRARAWRYGFNLLDLSFSYALAPAHPSDDRRPLSAAVDWVAVE